MRLNFITLFTALCLGLPLIVINFSGCAGDRYNRSTGEYVDDKALVLRVKSALSDSAEYKFGDVSVIAFRGTVQLNGFVNTSDQKNTPGRIVSRVEGVKKLENNITLKEDARD